MNALLESIAGPVLRFLVRTAGNLPTGGMLPLGDWAVDAWEGYSRRCNEAQMRAEIEKIVQDQKRFRAQVEVWVQQHAADQPEGVRRQVANYLNQMPGQIQRSLQRPEDPSGRTLPSSLRLQKADDLKQFLPERLPRFQAGDRPFSGSDLIVQELVGTGGFGEVWRAVHEHRPNAAPVALKFCTDEQAARSLLREVDLLDRVVSKGRHPGIVELKYAHLGSSLPCLEYEYVDGGDLAQLIQELHTAKQMTPTRAAELLLQVARSVGFAHRQSPPIVHRDLKPGNILVRRTANGDIELKVADFGIGSIASEQLIAEWSRSTQHASLGATTRGACTPLYASPQQRRAGPPDPRDDVYALGVIWYQMLTGDVTREPPRGSSWRKKFAEQGTPSSMIELLDQCLEDDAHDRPADAQVLAERLQALLSGGKPVSPDPQERPTPAIPLETSTRSVGHGTLVNLGADGLIHAGLTTLIGFFAFLIALAISGAISQGRGRQEVFVEATLFLLAATSSFTAFFYSSWTWRRLGITLFTALIVSIGLAVAFYQRVDNLWLGLAVSAGIGFITGFLRVWSQHHTLAAAPALALGGLLLSIPFFVNSVPGSSPLSGNNTLTSKLAGVWQTTLPVKEAKWEKEPPLEKLEFTRGGTMVLHRLSGGTQTVRYELVDEKHIRLKESNSWNEYQVDLPTNDELFLVRTTNYATYLSEVAGRWRRLPSGGAGEKKGEEKKDHKMYDDGKK